jgi:pimeloyl-ACP methyl ester carboxylesterase
MRFRRAFALVPWLAACHSFGGSAAAPLALSACRLDGLADEARCGTLEVFEDRAANSGKRIALRVAVVPALAAAARPDPIFVLVGGPGQAASEHAGEVVRMLEKERRRHDLVFVDQRGTGRSNPLDCAEPPDGGLAAELREAVDEPLLRACLARYARDGTHPEDYTTDAAADDLDDVRAALGAAQVDLWGISYGTRLGFAYLRRHGSAVRAAVFDGVSPPMHSVVRDAPRDAQRAFGLIFASCARDASCAAAFPDLETRLRQLLANLARQPAHVHLADPISGAPVDLTLTRDAFAMGLEGLLYVPELSSILPLLIDRASRGDFQPFAAEVSAFDLSSGVSRGLFYSVVCGEDAAVPGLDAGPGLLLGDGFARATRQVCGLWPHRVVPAADRAPVHVETPVLLLSGELDPVTPPSHAEEALAALPHGVSLVVPGAGHGVSSRGCVPELIAAFIDSAGAEAPAGDCVRQLDRPPFFVSFAGPHP